MCGKASVRSKTHAFMGKLFCRYPAICETSLCTLGFYFLHVIHVCLAYETLNIIELTCRFRKDPLSSSHFGFKVACPQKSMLGSRMGWKQSLCLIFCCLVPLILNMYMCIKFECIIRFNFHKNVLCKQNPLYTASKCGPSLF